MNKTTPVSAAHIEALKLAEKVLVEYRDTQCIQAPRKALAAIREALAELVKQQEPVAWRNAIKHWAFDCAWNDLTERQIDDLELLVIGVLNAAPVDAKTIPIDTDKSVTKEYLKWLDRRPSVGGNEAWNAGGAWALEEAAKVCDTEEIHRGNWFAAAIRSLCQKTDKEGMK